MRRRYGENLSTDSSITALKKVSIITGRASGMGLSTNHILDLNPSTDNSVASSLNPTFHECNATDEAALAQIFEPIFFESSRLDFLFANAGIAERANLYHQQEEGEDEQLLPIEGMHTLVDVNLKSVIITTYLTLHYMRKPPSDTDKSIVMTASCGGLYPSYYSPIYAATKHATVGFMRSIAPFFYHKAGIRVNAICPGVVKTNLLSSQEWANFPEEYFTPVERIAEVVCIFVDGKDYRHTRWAVDISGGHHYYREMVPYADEAMKALMGSTNIKVLDNVQPA
ncbi:NAD(P)-binding protein [Cucurbitaria berberidis CBS 394.84]|uniref:NAD(P)-binding protein n=1 Tax=Cucurbitaria berberidis CBS 394.84 TaxID=1168544 RepID=A0A9P4L767_9PLEO|nr:NAD(P)-binding protein [Cucurbitaria berberidis CBS 394.84]KAF1843997.1 NAD(P)-binding protein [Cucurbitaria berberidis CBS 394.84]